MLSYQDISRNPLNKVVLVWAVYDRVAKGGENWGLELTSRHWAARVSCLSVLLEA